MKCERCGSQAQVSFPVHDSALHFCQVCHEALQLKLSFENMIPKMLDLIKCEKCAEALKMLDHFWSHNCSKEKEGWLGYSIQSFESDIMARFGQIEQALSILRRLDQQCWHQINSQVTNRMATTEILKNTGEINEAIREMECAIKRLSNYFVISLICLLKRYAALMKEQHLQINDAFVPLILYLNEETNQEKNKNTHQAEPISEIVNSLKAPLPLVSTF